MAHSLLTPRRAEAWRAAAPTVLPATRPRPTHSPAYRLPIRLVRVALILAVLLALALFFFLFGEERPERVHPTLTPAQRARAFRATHYGN